MMLSNNGLKRKSSSPAIENNHLTNPSHTNHQLTSTINKKFRGINYDGKINQHEPRMSLLSNTIKSEPATKKLTMINGETTKVFKRLDESELTPAMLAEYRRLQHELQCQEALLVLMQKLKTNQRLSSQTNNNGVKQRATATKLNQQNATSDGKSQITATKQSQPSATNNSNRTTPTKPPHPNQYTVNRSNVNSQNSGQSSSKSGLLQAQATRQSSATTVNNSTLPTAATRLSSTVPTSATKVSSNTSSTSSSSKSNGVAAEQHLLNAKLALRKQLEQTLLQIPTPKPSTCDLTFIPGVNGWSEFLAYLGLEQAFNTYTDIVNRRPPSDVSMILPHVCAQCGTDWSVTWHEISSTNESTNESEEKILCDRCTKTSQKKLLKQDHSNRLRQAFIKALQQEKELDAKFQQQSSTSSTTNSTNANTTITTTAGSSTPTSTVKQSSSSQSQSSSKHVHSSHKHSNKPLSTKTSANHHHHHHHHHSHHNSTSNNHNHHSHSHSHHHHHSSSSKTGGSSSSKSHHNSSPALPNLSLGSAETLASTLAALQTNEQVELFQKHFLSNMLPFAVANQAAAVAALTSKSSQQQQQQALAAFPAMAASLMRQPNAAQYLLDMIPQAAKQQQQQQHHHHSK